MNIGLDMIESGPKIVW